MLGALLILGFAIFLAFFEPVLASRKLLNKDNTINAAGGFIIQLMPHCPDEIIDKLEIKINNLRPVTTMLSEGMSPNDILKDILGDMDLEFNESLDLCFKCNCDKERIEKALISVGEKVAGNDR